MCRPRASVTYLNKNVVVRRQVVSLRNVRVDRIGLGVSAALSHVPFDILDHAVLPRQLAMVGVVIHYLVVAESHAGEKKKLMLDGQHVRVAN